MKLSYKRVLLVGMAFFLITAFWQAYDAIIPLILTNHFGLPQTASGAIMSIDNVLAVFMLPLFGAISDKAHTKYGKRTPFIFFGTIVSVIFFLILTVIDNYQLAKVISRGIPEMTKGALSDAGILRICPGIAQGLYRGKYNRYRRHRLLSGFLSHNPQNREQGYEEEQEDSRQGSKIHQAVPQRIYPRYGNVFGYYGHLRP